MPAEAPNPHLLRLVIILLSAFQIVSVTGPADAVLLKPSHQVMLARGSAACSACTWVLCQAHAVDLSCTQQQAMAVAERRGGGVAAPSPEPEEVPLYHTF
jgi:hypothetical protein